MKSTPKVKAPKGWVLVPKTPTVEMMEAAEDCYVRSYTGTYTADAMEIWNAMIKASQKSLKKESK